MMINAPSPAASDNLYHFSHDHACPHCGGYTYRIPRRFVDLFMSHFVSVHRYRCGSGCDWEGNIRDK
jgi:hypothetical protein